MQWLETELEALRKLDRLRIPAVVTWLSPTQVRVHGRDAVAFCGNDYLALRHHPDLMAAAVEATNQHGTGSGASRLVSGNLTITERAEAALASLVNLPSALLMSSGYAANTGAIPALMDRRDVVFSDALNHASLIDGIRLSGATVVIVPHRNLAALEDRIQTLHPHRRRWVVTESVFSMDGDTADLPHLRSVCDRHGMALYVDEAHALGTLGPDGGGLCRATGVTPEVLVGTLGKSLGASGAFVAGSHPLRSWLWNRCRSLVFSTGVTPAVAASALAAVKCLQRDTGPTEQLRANVQHLRRTLANQGIAVGGAPGIPILPVVVGTDRRALAVRDTLLDHGFFVQAIRPPTVPDGTARLRITVSSAHHPEQMDALASALAASLHEHPETHAP